MLKTVALTKFQRVVQQHLLQADGTHSLLLVAPTGLGKTLAATADLAHARRKIIYGVPLRALAGSILDDIEGLQRAGTPIQAVVHHGNVQDSHLFSEEVVVTTYDQIVCAVPGLPLSLPLSAGHAVAGALLMSRLVLDEVHLAWSISPDALSILFGILQFRQRLGLQTVVMTATIPKSVARLIADRLKLKLVIAGEDETKDDEALVKRNENRYVHISRLQVKSQKADEKDVDLSEIIKTLRGCKNKCIYFSNTVERLQRTYDLLERSGIDMGLVTVLHNRMPGSWRAEAEVLVKLRFGKTSESFARWILLTNQVAEAGLDISAPVVLSDPAPVDTLIQRAGRCARWFRNGRTEGIFQVISPTKTRLSDWAPPYKAKPVELALATLNTEVLDQSSSTSLSWDVERRWIDSAWLGIEKESDRHKELEKHLDGTAFALNLFDRASQQNSPGAIAGAFREVLSVQIAVVDQTDISDAELLATLKSGYDLDASSVSLQTGYRLLARSKGKATVLRYRDELTLETQPAHLVSGDLLLIPSSVAFLHRAKGLCFSDQATPENSILKSELRPKPGGQRYMASNANAQSLWTHTLGVMRRVEARLLSDGDYRSALGKILTALEGRERADEQANLIGRLAVLATGFHDLGKCDTRWQRRAHEVDPGSAEELIGRTSNRSEKIGVPHTPPGFYAAAAACGAALGYLNETNHLVRAIALASARHHSSLLNPSSVRGYVFDPVDAASEFVRRVLSEAGLQNIAVATILSAAAAGGSPAEIPLMLPNDDLFPIYALIGRAILLSDREDAAGKPLEVWSQHV